MANKALFTGLIYDEMEQPVATSYVGSDMQYVVDDNGFHRHIDAEYVDRQVLGFFLSQLEQNKDVAVEQALNMMGKDDIFTKAAVDAQINNIDMDQIMQVGIPEQARNMLAMMGFRIIINFRGEIVKIDQPSLPDSDE